MTPPAGVAGQTAFLATHKRCPTVKQDGIVAWLKDMIEYLEMIKRTERGDGALGAFKETLREIEAVGCNDA